MFVDASVTVDMLDQVQARAQLQDDLRALEGKGVPDCQNVRTLILAKGTPKRLLESIYQQLKMGRYPKMNSLHLGTESVGKVTGVFQKCPSLSSVEAVHPPASLFVLKFLSQRCFINCRALRTVNLSASVIRTIPGACFKGCTSLRRITLPKTTLNIGEEAFAGCTFTSENQSSLQVKVPGVADGQRWAKCRYVHPTAFAGTATRFLREPYSPQTHINVVKVDKGKRLMALITAKEYNAELSDQLFFATDLALCLRGTSHNDDPDLEWYLHTFRVKRNLQMLSAASKFREAILKPNKQYKKVEAQLVTLCNELGQDWEGGIDGWFARSKLDIDASASSSSTKALSAQGALHEYALLSDKFSACLEQTAVQPVTRRALEGYNVFTVQKGCIRLKHKTTKERKWLPPRATKKRQAKTPKHAPKKQKTFDVAAAPSFSDSSSDEELLYPLFMKLRF